MADSKISALAPLTGANTAATDLLVIVDVSDTSMAPSGTNKNIQVTELQQAPIASGTANGVTYLNGSKVLTSSSALTFDGNNFTQSGANAAVTLQVNTANAGVSASNYSEIALSDVGAVRTYWRSMRDGSGATIFSGNDHIRYALTGSERMRLSSTGLAVTGALSATGNNDRWFTASGSNPRFDLNGARDWALQTVDSDGRLRIYDESGGGERLTIDASGNLTPGADNTQNIGSGALRWATVYAGTGTINTSDAREKTTVRSLTAAEIAAAKQLSAEIGSYQWLSAIAEKGEAAREHIGLTVQRAIEVMQANGLDPMRYGFICYDQWDDVFVEHPAIEAVAAQDATFDEDGNELTPAVAAVEGKAAWTEQTRTAGNRYSFRMDELLLFMARGFETRLAALEAA